MNARIDKEIYDELSAYSKAERCACFTPAQKILYHVAVHRNGFGGGLCFAVAYDLVPDRPRGTKLQVLKIEIALAKC